MKILLLTIAILTSAVMCHAQSLEKEDYVPIFVHDGSKYMVDKTSVAYAKNGNVVLWALTGKKGILLFMSFEINCDQKLLRIRSMKAADVETGKIFTKNATTPWMSPYDTLANKFIDLMCAPSM